MARVVTLMFTDIEGSTRLWETATEAMAAALRGHDELMRRVIARHEGLVFKTVGDAFCAVFTEADAAVDAAAEAQRELVAATWPTPRPIRVRIGIHSGACEERDGDFFGPTVNRVARIAAIGHGGQTLVSGATAERLSGDRPGRLIDHGEHRLKDLGAPEHVFGFPAHDEPEAFPALRSLGSKATPNNLPVHLSEFVGRRHEFEALGAVLDRSRLVTVLGPGGVGKTRLALHLLADRLQAFTAGVWVVELAPVVDRSDVLMAINKVLGTSPGPADDPLDALVQGIGNRPLLLLLDNAEHVIDLAAKLTDRILRDCSNVRIIVTSRELLRIDGEQPFRLLPMATTAPGGSPADAIEFFAHCARRAVPEFDASAVRAEDVRELCERLDGLPLAIELAAARLRSMSLPELLSRLDQRFRLLASGGRLASGRQQTLRGLIEWSYRLLDPVERALFRQLSVFRGGWTLNAAERMAAELGWPDPFDVMDLMSSLVDKSLVDVERHESGTRYRFLESIGEFSSTITIEENPGELEATKDAHLAATAELVSTLAPSTSGPDQLQALDRLWREEANIWAAVDHAIVAAKPEHGLALLAALPIGFFHGFDPRVSARIDELLALVGDRPSPHRGAVLMISAFHLSSDRLDDAQRRAQEAHRLAVEAADPVAQATALRLSAWIRFDGGDLVGALASIDAAKGLAARADRLEAMLIASTRAEILLQLDRIDEALADQDRAAALADELGGPIPIAHRRFYRARLLLVAGRDDEALVALRSIDTSVDRQLEAWVLHLSAHLELAHGAGAAHARQLTALTMLSRLGDTAAIVSSLVSVAAGLRQLGRPDQATALIAAVDEIADRLGFALPDPAASWRRRLVEEPAEQSAPDPEPLTGLTLDELIGWAHDVSGSLHPGCR